MMRTRTTGTTAGDRPQLPARPQSQSFRPKSEWKYEEAASFLFVYLPGFVVEQLTVTPDYSNRTVKVQGERRLPNNRLLPVNETFSIPEDCDLAKMDKQFGRGILMLKMPRNVIPQLAPPQQTTKETEQEASKPQETVGDEEPTGPSKETSTAGFEKQSPDEAVAPAAALVPPVTTSDDVSVSAKVIDENGAKTAGTSDEEKLVEKKEENDSSGKPIQPESPENVAQNDGVTEEESKKEPSQESAMAADKVKEIKEKEKSKQLSADHAKWKEKEKLNVSAKKDMIKELKEDKSLIINMGAAILIIAGLGASLFYTLRP